MPRKTRQRMTRQGRRTRRTRRRSGSGYLENIVAIREKARVSSRRALELATTTMRNREGIHAADQNYRAAIQRAAVSILYPPTDFILHYGIYSRVVSPIRFDETRAIVHAQLPTDTLRQMIAQHASFANRAASLTRRMAEQARRLSMTDATRARDLEEERRATIKTVEEINRNAKSLENAITTLGEPQERIIESEDKAFDIIRSLSLKPGTDEDALMSFQFTLHTSTDAANHYKGKRLLAEILYAPSGAAPTYMEVPPSLVRDNLPVLEKWVKVSRNLITAMKTAQPTSELHVNLTKNRGMFVEGFRIENLIATYKITALVAWLLWKGRQRALIKPAAGHTPTREEIQEEVAALEAELVFFTVYQEWLAYYLANKTNPVGKSAMEKQLAMLDAAMKPGGWIVLRKEHARLRKAAVIDVSDRRHSSIRPPTSASTSAKTSSRPSSPLRR